MESTTEEMTDAERKQSAEEATGVESDGDGGNS
jgi:hypothetical protein